MEAGDAEILRFLPGKRRVNPIAMLNDYQRRGLSITLRIVEESVRDLEQIYHDDGYPGVMYEIRNDIPREIRDQVSRNIPRVKAEIRKIADTFHLEKPLRWTSNLAYGKLPYCWEILGNARAERLKRYGDISSGLGEELDPHLDSIIQILGEMEQILLAIRSKS